MSELIGHNRKGNALLCYFWGETDVPVVAIARTTSDVRKAIADEWLGESEGEEMDSILSQISDHDFGENSLRFEFEIGGVTFEDIAAAVSTEPIYKKGS